MRILVFAFVLAATVSVSGAQAATLDRIRDTGILNIGYREDAAPFSFKNALDEPAGYSVDLCRAIAVDFKRQLGLEAISIRYVPVSAENRFEAVQRGRVDLLCGAATATLARRELVDFSLPIFIDGASVMYRSDGPSKFSELVGQNIGVRLGTTTEQSLKKSLAADSIDAKVIAVKDHKDGLKQLQSGAISAYFADQAILVFLVARNETAKGLRISKRFFTHEPYAIALPRGDTDLRLAVDRGLSRIYRSGAIEKIFGKSFGLGKPSDLLKALYVVSSLPD